MIWTLVGAIDVLLAALMLYGAGWSAQVGWVALPALILCGVPGTALAARRWRRESNGVLPDNRAPGRSTLTAVGVGLLAAGLLMFGLGPLFGFLLALPHILKTGLRNPGEAAGSIGGALVGAVVNLAYLRRSWRWRPRVVASSEVAP